METKGKRQSLLFFSVTPDRSKSCCCQGMPNSLAHHSLVAIGKFITGTRQY